MSTQRYSVTPHPIETILTWVKKRILIDDEQRLKGVVTVSAHAARAAIALSTRNGLFPAAV